MVSIVWHYSFSAPFVCFSNPRMGVCLNAWKLTIFLFDLGFAIIVIPLRSFIFSGRDEWSCLLALIYESYFGFSCSACILCMHFLLPDNTYLGAHLFRGLLYLLLRLPCFCLFAAVIAVTPLKRCLTFYQWYTRCLSFCPLLAPFGTDFCQWATRCLSDRRTFCRVRR